MYENIANAPNLLATDRGLLVGTLMTRIHKHATTEGVLTTLWHVVRGN